MAEVRVVTATYIFILSTKIAEPERGQSEPTRLFSQALTAREGEDNEGWRQPSAAADAA
jgi:hypothetical protein